MRRVSLLPYSIDGETEAQRGLVTSPGHTAMMLWGPDGAQRMHMLYQNEAFLHPSSPCRIVSPHQQGLSSHWGWDQSSQRERPVMEHEQFRHAHYTRQAYNLRDCLLEFLFFECFNI